MPDVDRNHQAMKRSASVKRVGRSARFHVLLSTAINALGVLLLQLFALVFLDPFSFGAFSLVYLGYAFACSVTYSVLCEAWLRQRNRLSWSSFASVLVALSVTFGIAVAALSVAMFDGVAFVLPVFIAVTASTYRVGARYVASVRGELRAVLLPDVAGVIPLLAAWTASLWNEFSLSEFLWVWAICSLCSLIGSLRPKRFHRSFLVHWIRRHGRDIRVLLADSLLMDLAAIGVPFLLAPVLGLFSFGIYRAVSNAAAPVRLMLNPLRPVIAAQPIVNQVGPRRLTGVALLAALLGSGVTLSLLGLAALGWQIGTLTALAPFALPTGIFVAANFLGHYAYLCGRGSLTGKQLSFGRIVQTSLGIVLPLFGAIVLMLPGAIWGYAMATLVSGLFWVGLLVSAAWRLQRMNASNGC